MEKKLMSPERHINMMNNRENENLNKPIIGDRYLHYKGGIYEVISLGKHTELETILELLEGIDEKARNIWIKVPNREINEMTDLGNDIFSIRQLLQQDHVVYKSLQYGTTHIRPLSVWNEPVKKNGGNPDRQDRFKPYKP